MSRRPALVTVASAAALALCAASGTASAATTGAPAAGRAASSMSLLDLTVGGHHLSLAQLALLSDTVASPHTSSVSITPLVADGTAYGRQTVSPSSSPTSVPAVSAPGALAALAQLTSPAISASASSTPANQAGASSLGSVKVLGLPVNLAGALQTASSVTTANGASALKTVSVKNLQLPSIADILGALGLDLSALPVDTLDELVNGLELVNGAVTTAEGAVDTAQAAVDQATATLAAKNATLSSATSSLTAAQSTLTSATTALTSAIQANSAVLSPLGITDITTLVGSVDPARATALALPGMQSALDGYTSAQTAVTTAQAAVATAQAAVDAAQAALTTVTNTLTGALHTLLTTLTGVLDGTPLVSLDSLQVSTKAAARTASKGGQQAEVVGGTIKGLHVLGVDVLDNVLGSSSVSLDAVTSTVLGKVNGLMDQVTGTLSDVLSNVPSLPALKVPAPNVQLLTKSASTSVSGGFGRASTVVQGLSISLPAITVPSSVAVPQAASLPALTGVTQAAGTFVSAPVSLGLLTLHDQAAFRPAVTGTSTNAGAPGTGGHLADTGLPAGVAVLSLLVVGGALLVHRRLVTA